MREHRGSNAGKPDVQATNQGGRVGNGGAIQTPFVSFNLDTSGLKKAVEDAKWQLQPSTTITLSVGGILKVKTGKSLKEEITMHVSGEMAKRLREEIK